MDTEELKEITWQELKDFVNSIPSEFLNGKAHILVSDDNEGKKLNEPFFLDENVYYHKDGFPDESANLEEVMLMNEDYDIDNYELGTKKGTPFLWADSVEKRSNCFDSKFTLMVGEKSITMKLGQSPRGLRIEDKRPDKILIESNELFGFLELRKYIEYLNALSMAMTFKDEKG